MSALCRFLVPPVCGTLGAGKSWTICTTQIGIHTNNTGEWMSTTEKHTPVGNDVTQGQTLDGGWLRKERERVALGRRKLGDHLGLSEVVLTRVETRKLPIPSAWLPTLLTLGFRIPGETAQTTTVGEVLEKQTEMAPKAEHVVNTQNDPNIVNVAVPSTEPQQEDSKASPEPEQKDLLPKSDAEPPNGVADVQPKGGAVAPAQETVVSSGEQEGARGAKAMEPGFFCGKWLGERLSHITLSKEAVCRALGCTLTELRLLVDLDLRLPHRFISPFKRLSIVTNAESLQAVTLPSVIRYDGIWLSRQRGLLGMSKEELAEHLQISAADLGYIEAKVLPLPVGWPEQLDALRKEHGLKSHKSLSEQGRRGPGRRWNSGRPIGDHGGTPSASSSASSSAPAAPRPYRRRMQNADTSFGESIVEQRVTFGKRIGASPHEVLVMIAQDLLAAKEHVGFGYDALQAAAKLLLQKTS